MTKRTKLFLATCASTWAGISCSDNGGTPQAQPDATSEVDSGAPQDDAAAADVTPDVPPLPFPKPTPMALALSSMGPDQLQSVAPGPNGTFYAAGFLADTAAGTKYVTVVKLTTTGLDTTFGVNGIAKTTIACSGGADEIDIVVQPSGKLVVSATVANTIHADDRDVAVLRLDATGALDTTFGEGGVRVLDLNTALDATQSAQRDGARSLAVGANGELFVHATTRGAGARTDSDFALVKLTADGAVDTSFASGKFTLDFGTPSANATPRGIHVLADGSILASGYASSSLSGNTPQVVLYKLSPTGGLASTFADNGVFHSIVLTLQTEAYNFAVHGTHAVTAGYGRRSGTTNDWVSLRFDTTTGVRDPQWGGAQEGAVVFDPSGKQLGSNCRNAIGLPQGKTLLVGSTGAANTTAQDAVFAVLDANGKLDTQYGTGVHVLPFGAGEGGNDQLWGAAVSGTHVMLVGYKGATTQTDALNDDAYAVAFPLR